MPKMSASKEEIKGQEALPEGMYQVALRGFKPKKSKAGDSVNLNPDLRVINHPTLNDKKIFLSLNSGAAFMWPEFTHMFGLPLEDDGSGELTIPGDFTGPEADPSKWVYSGPLLNQEGSLYLVIREYQGKNQNDVKQFVCRMPGCDHKHKEFGNK
jgi:hypothetical protein